MLTVSDRCAAGTAEDISGPLLVEALREHGFTCSAPSVIPDDEENTRNVLFWMLTRGARIILTTGGTGIHPRDRTPEATRHLIDLELPGLADAIRAAGAAHNPYAVLSRGRAGIALGPDSPDGTLIVNLPGSVSAVRDGLGVLLPLLPHILSQLKGEHH